MSAILYVGNRNYSSWSLRGSLIVRQSRIACDEVVIPLDLPGTRERIAAVSPSGRVPVLHHHGMVVWDSLAIAELLHEERPDAGLWPRDAAQRALARSVSAEMHSSFMALRDAMPMDVRAENLEVERTDEIEGDIARIVAIWSDCRRKAEVAGPYLFGVWTAADAMYAPVVSRFRTYGVDLVGIARDYADAVWAWPDVANLVAEAAREPWSLDTGV